MPRTTITLSVSVPVDVATEVRALVCRAEYPTSPSAVVTTLLREALAARRGPDASPEDVEPWDGTGRPSDAQVRLYARTVAGSSEPGYDPELEARAEALGLR